MSDADSRPLQPNNARSRSPSSPLRGGGGEPSFSLPGMGGGATMAPPPLISAAPVVDPKLRREQVERVVEWAEALVEAILCVEDPVVSVSEVRCGQPGCPPWEVVLVVMEDKKTTKIQIPKALMELKEEEIKQAIQEEKDAPQGGQGAAGGGAGGMRTTHSAAVAQVAIVAPPAAAPPPPKQGWKERKLCAEDGLYGGIGDVW